MKKQTVFLVFIITLFYIRLSAAQDVVVKKTSWGVIMGDPIGATMKYRISPGHAFDVSFGPDYFGSPRLQLDYVWELNIFHSQIAKAYAGPGLAVALGKGVKTFFSHEPNLESFANEEDNGFGFGGRTIFGITITPKRSSLQYFVEGGPLLGFNRFMDLDLDGAVGVRYSL